MSKDWTSFIHQIWKNLKDHDLENHDLFILAVSGGLDSMVLLDVFLKLKPKATIKVAHYHHGDSADITLKIFRDKAYELVKNKIFDLNLKNVTFISEKSTISLDTEEQMRKYRWKYLRSLVSTNEILITAHHVDDWFETIILKMIRGTSIDGAFSFKMWNHDIYRPFLETSKAELLAYAQNQKINWIEDPSNSEDLYLRNWLREKWLKDLDEKVPSGSKNLARSLFNINKAISSSQTLELVYVDDSESLNRQWYVSLSKSDQLRCLALFLKKHQIHSFTTGHLEEVRKRLDKTQKDIKFELLGRKWVINALQIMLQ